jgi:hypothetical protein
MTFAKLNFMKETSIFEIKIPNVKFDSIFEMIFQNRNRYILVHKS